LGMMSDASEDDGCTIERKVWLWK